MGAWYLVLGVWLRARPHSRDLSAVPPPVELRILQGSGLHEQKATINDAQGRGTSIDHETMDDPVEGGRIDAQS